MNGSEQPHMVIAARDFIERERCEGRALPRLIIRTGRPPDNQMKDFHSTEVNISDPSEFSQRVRDFMVARWPADDGIAHRANQTLENAIINHLRNDS